MRRPAALALLLSCLLPGVASPQSSGGGEPQPTAAPASPVVSTRFGGVKVTLGGSVRTTVTSTSARMVPDATPFFVLPDVGVEGGSTKIDARLSTLLVSIEGLPWHSFKFGALILGQFFNGDLLSGQYGFYPGALYVDLKNDDWRFAFGMQMDVFSPRIPTMVDAMSALASSGNPGNSFRAELRAERHVQLGDRDRLSLVGAASDALPTNIDPEFTRYTENVGWPNGEVHAAWKHGAADPEARVAWAPVELGVSAVTGKFRTFSPGGAFAAFETRLWGVAVDGALRVGRRFGVQGEYYTGQSMGPYLGAINQTVNLQTQQAIDSHGGWGEVAWYWTAKAHSHAGYGKDIAGRAQLAPGSFTTNATAFVNLFYDQSPMVRFGVEGTWRKTEYLGLPGNSGYALMLMSEFRF